MKYFYYKLALLIALCCSVSLANANPTLKQCIDKCHKTSLNLKDFKHCKEGCKQRIKKRLSKKKYHKNYAGPTAEGMPSVETTVRAATPEQAEIAAVAATGAAASVLSATSPQSIAVEEPAISPAQSTEQVLAEPQADAVAE